MATGRCQALFRARQCTDSVNVALGQKIYEEFNTVVILKKQQRVTDPVWRDFLQHLRKGEVNTQHLVMLRTLIIGQPQHIPEELSSVHWRNAPLITPRHAVRERWNSLAVRKECKLYVVVAQDTIRGRPLTLAERYALAVRNKNSGGQKDLPEKLEVAIGMKIMVTTNVETDLDITNRAQGEVVDIRLHPDEPVTMGCTVHLKYLPAYILVRLERTRASQLPGLPEAVLPLETVSTAMQVKVETGDGKTSRTVKRQQFPLTAGYAFTDYRSQGQTIPYVLVDIMSPPPPGTLSLFNLYVVLSRSSGRGTIQLLRDFDNKLFLQAHDTDLTAEDARLEDLNNSTAEWWKNTK